MLISQEPEIARTQKIISRLHMERFDSSLVTDGKVPPVSVPAISSDRDNGASSADMESQFLFNKDPLIVVCFDHQCSLGLISYVKRHEPLQGEHYVHTLNTPLGFQRKLKALQVHLHAKAISTEEE